MALKHNHQKEDVFAGVYDFSGYSIAIRNDDIIQLEFKDDFNITVKDAQDQVEIFKKIKRSRKCLLPAIFKENNLFSKETREYMSGDGVSEVVKADALVIKGLALRILANGYLVINKPKRPIRLFNSKKSALQWLNQFKD